MKIGLRITGFVLIALIVYAGGAALAADAPKRGGTLTYLIPTNSPPSFDGHREWTFATAHTAAPFYSVLIQVNPENLSSTTDFVCDLCTEVPNPTDNGTTYTFKIRSGVKFHDGSALTAADVAASWNKIVFPPEGVISTRQRNYSMVDRIEAPDASTVVFHLKFPTAAFLPALADPMSWIYKKAILDKDMHWYEKNILGSGPFKFAGYEAGQSIKGVRNPDYYHSGPPLSRRVHGPLRTQAGDPRRCAARRPRGDRVPRFPAQCARRTRHGTWRPDQGRGERLELQQSDHPEPRPQTV